MARRNWASRHLPTFTRAGAWMGDRVRGAIAGTRFGAYAHQGAASNRLTMDWILAPIASADREIRGDLRTLRARGRELGRNDAHGARALSLLEENVVGPFGMTLQAKISTGDENVDQKVNAAIEEAWERWCRHENCSVDGKLCFVDIEKLLVRSRFQDGEALVRIVEGFSGSPFGFALQVLDPDQLDHTYDRFRRGDQADQTEIRMGIEQDEWGKPTVYHVFKRHPYDLVSSGGSQERIPIPASQIIHLFRVKRPGQTRGVTDFAPVMMDLRMLHGYREAELVAARMGAAQGGFFTKPEGSGDTPDPNSVRGGKKNLEMTAEPGLYTTLPEGYAFIPNNPVHPTTAFHDFVKGILKTIGAGIRAAYASLSGDLTEVSFSSIRKGDLAERASYADEQWLLIRYLHERIYPIWLKWALTTGQLQLPSKRVSDWLAHSWMPKGWVWVDPLKDLLADELSIGLGLDSRTNISAQSGRDYADVIADLKREQKMAIAAGVDVSNFKGSQAGGGSGGNAALNTANAPGAASIARRIVMRETDDPELRDMLALYEKRGPLAHPVNGNGNGNGKHHADEVEDSGLAVLLLRALAESTAAHRMVAAALSQLDVPDHVVNVQPAAAPLVTVHAPQQAAPQIDVHVPQAAAPSVHVDGPTVHVAAPEVRVEAPQVHIEAVPVDVTLQAPRIARETVTTTRPDGTESRMLVTRESGE